MAARYNVAPTQMVPIIVMDENGKPALIEARWGFIPHYWNKPTPPTLTTNARSETAAAKPMWKHAWRNTRCLIPASGWYEWFILEDGSKKPPKIPHHLRRQDGKHILFAGLWSTFRAAPDSPGLPVVQHRDDQIPSQCCGDPCPDPRGTRARVLAAVDRSGGEGPSCGLGDGQGRRRPIVLETHLGQRCGELAESGSSTRRAVASTRDRAAARNTGG
jgi:hypothetical protein